MFLQEPSRTQFDWNFSLLGFPVRVHPLFWLITVALAWHSEGVKPQELLLWVVSVFVSIVIHELGHAWMARYFGASAHIVLYSFGGLAVSHPEPRNVWDRVAICFAGPAAGFLFALIIAAALAASGQHVTFVWDWIPIQFDGFAEPNLNLLILYLLYINCLWGLVNLLPIYPLDGGQIARNLFMHYDWRAGLRNSQRLSMGVAIALAVYLLAQSVQAGGRPDVTVFMLGYLAYLNYQEMNPSGMRGPW